MVLGTGRDSSGSQYRFKLLVTSLPDNKIAATPNATTKSRCGSSANLQSTGVRRRSVSLRQLPVRAQSLIGCGEIFALKDRQNFMKG